MEATTATRPLIVAENGTAPDSLDMQPVVELPGSALRPGMVLLDDLDCPSVLLDHKRRTGNRHGENQWMALDLDVHTLIDLTTTRTTTYRVAGR